MPQVVCTCKYCRRKTVTIAGVRQPGHYVDVSTRIKHEKRDHMEDHEPVFPQQPQSPVTLSASSSKNQGLCLMDNLYFVCQ